jgi:hypothetical protein
MNPHIQPRFKGNVGVFLVAAKLSAMNMVALTTSRNTKGYDIVILNPETNKGKGIQVKCTDKKEFPVVGTFLKTIEEELREKITCDFVFVDISREPRFFILSKDELSSIIKTNTQRWLTVGKHRKPPEKMIATEKKKQLHVVKLSDIEKYENNWGLILHDL